MHLSLLTLLLEMQCGKEPKEEDLGRKRQWLCCCQFFCKVGHGQEYFEGSANAIQLLLMGSGAGHEVAGKLDCWIPPHVV